jgi:iron complex transport system permease protein
VLPFARELNLLARGEVTARALGVRVGRLRGLVYGLGSLLTAVAVTTVGSVGFVGLIVPHLVRLAIGNDQRLLLPAATLAGGVLLCAADTAARTVVAPIQLPVGAHRADRRAGVPVPAGEAPAMNGCPPPVLAPNGSPCRWGAGAASSTSRCSPATPW